MVLAAEAQPALWLVGWRVVEAEQQLYHVPSTTSSCGLPAAVETAF